MTSSLKQSVLITLHGCHASGVAHRLDDLLQAGVVKAMNWLVAIFFTIDAIMKMIAQGVLFTTTAYFQVGILILT